MKKYIQLLLAAGIAWSTLSCQTRNKVNSNTEIAETEITESEVEATDTEENTTDSLQLQMQEEQKLLFDEVDSLTASVADMQKKMEVMDQKLKKMESPKDPWHIATVLAMVLAVLIPLIIYFLMRRREDEKQKEIQILQKANEGLAFELTTLKNTLDAQKSKYKEVENVVNEHARLINGLMQKQSASVKPVTPSNKKTTPPTFQPQQRYAELNSGPFFLNLLTAKTETCIFDIKLTSETTGEFTIVSINKIQSVNDWESVVDCYGDVKTAKGFRVERMGKCQLTSDGKAWKVTEKLKIQTL